MDYIVHYGIKGQQHGKRRFQNEDGSLTEAGKLRYGRAGGHRVGPRELSKKEKSYRKSRKNY